MTVRVLTVCMCIGICVTGFPSKTNTIRNDEQRNDLPKDKHGRIMMGIKHEGCDDGKWNLQMDWDKADDLSYSYTCQPEEREQLSKQRYGLNSNDSIFVADQLYGAEEQCLAQSSIPMPGHVCMDRAIHYADTPPRSGSHRPLWPAFGEYRFLPTSRWVHGLEHGAVAFLYHPCADAVGIELMKIMARSCLWKHLITPYRHMKKEFAIVTYGCRLMMNYFDPQKAYEFIIKHALVDSPEEHNIRNGSFLAELISAAEVVPGSNAHDQCICPYWSSHRFSLEAYMSWRSQIERIVEARERGENVNHSNETFRFGQDVDLVKVNGCPL